MYSLPFRKLFYIIQRLRDAMRNGMSTLGTLGFFFFGADKDRPENIVGSGEIICVRNVCYINIFFSFFILSAGCFMIKIDAS